jgi:hypothetical protein
MPSDDMNRSFHWDAAEALTALNFLVGQGVANTTDRPRWNTNDILGDRFAKPPAR